MAEMAEIQVDGGQLNGAASEMRGVVRDMEALMGQLNSAAHSAASGWQGASEASFMEMWNRWVHALQQLATAIEETAKHLNQAAAIYEETDQTAIQLPDR